MHLRLYLRLHLRYHFRVHLGLYLRCVCISLVGALSNAQNSTKYFFYWWTDAALEVTLHSGLSVALEGHFIVHFKEQLKMNKKVAKKTDLTLICWCI